MKDWPEDVKTAMECGWCIHYDPYGDACGLCHPIGRGPCKDFRDDRTEGKRCEKKSKTPA